MITDILINILSRMPLTWLTFFMNRYEIIYDIELSPSHSDTLIAMNTRDKHRTFAFTESHALRKFHNCYIGIDGPNAINVNIRKL